MKRFCTALIPSFFAAIAISGSDPIIGTANAQTTTTGKSGLPLPRFVSLKSKRVNMRVGPGKQYQVVWLYLKPGLPMEIIQEFDNWRQVRDPEGNEGWILHSLLSGSRTAVVKPWETDLANGQANLVIEPSTSSQVIAKLEPGVVMEVGACSVDWCNINVKNVEGYIPKKDIWGVYPDEKIEN